MGRVGAAIWLLVMAPAFCQEPDVKSLTADSRRVAQELVTQVRAELLRALEFSGPLRGMAVCKYSVPELTSALSRKTGWRVSRVSLKPRNPALATPDAWEQRVLTEFERRVEAGEKAAGMEYGEFVDEPHGRYFRYMRALPLTQACMACHGPADKLAEPVRSALASDYPSDPATGYAVGQVRGAVTVKRPL